MPTDITVINPNDITEPKNAMALPTLIARSAAMKNVLSPSSLMKMRVNDSTNPDGEGIAWRSANAGSRI